MKKIFIIVILINLFGFIPKAFSDMQWEDCTEGLWGGQINRMYILENEIEMYSNYSYSSNDSGKSWTPRKYLLPFFKEEEYWPITNITKYKNRYLMSPYNYRVDYISEDKKKLYGTKTYGGPTPAYLMDGFACDSSIILRFYDSTLQKMRTYITQDEPQGNEGNFHIVPIPEENDFTDTTYKRTCFFINEGRIIATVRREEFKPFKKTYAYKFYYSTDWGWSWKEIRASEVYGGIMSVQYLSGKYYLFSTTTIWRQDENGKYVMCEDGEDGKFDYLENSFLIGYKDKIIASGLETGTHKYVLASSTDGGKTWERFGTSDFKVKELLTIGDKIIANTQSFGVMISTDDGQTWVESNKGLYDSPNNYDASFMKIWIDGNNAYTVPRNLNLRNTIMKSYDGGRSWVKKQVDTSLGYCEFPNYDYEYTVALTKWGLYAMNRGNNTTYRSYDNGETWQFYSNGAIFHDKYNIYERNDTLFYCFSWPYENKKLIFYSLDTGKTQILYDSTYRHRLPDNCWHFTLADGVYYALNKAHKFYKSTDEGNHWEFVNQFTLPCADTNTKIFWIDLETEKIKIFLSPIPSSSHGRDSVFMSDNFGKTWKFIPYPSDTLSYGEWADLNGSLYLMSSSPQNRVFKTTDEGTTWEDITDELADKTIMDFIPAGDYLYVSTIEGLYRIYSPPVSVKESKTEEVILPIELYPSPARDIIYVKNDYWGINEVKVYDMLGRECAVGVFNINQFDVSNLQSGVYLAKFIFPGNWSIIKKFVKM
ncbi:MAG TPA: T9SS type A sorting domain-containing protein [Candidatus Kapabacteria bacterium]|nr:T9SS type A sorting domain-containing protein [Candidatus Kapabacteria bacterium]